MFDDFNADADDRLSPDEGFKLLQELERNKPEEIRRLRTHFRVTIKAAVTLQPGNSSERLSFKLKGVAGDVSESGLGALFPLPAKVGDVYRMEFDRNGLDLPLTFVRCVRCRLVREDAFDCGFQFFAPIPLPANLYGAADVSAGPR